MLDDAHVMAGIDIDDVEPRLARPERRLPVPAAHLGDIGLVHAARLHRVGAVRDDVRGGERNHPAVAIGRVQAVVDQLNRRKTAVFVDLVGDQ